MIMQKETISRAILVSFIFVALTTQQIYTMTPPPNNSSVQRSEGELILQQLQKTTGLTAPVCNTIMAYLYSWTWKLQCIHKVDNRSDNFRTSNTVILTNTAHIWSNYDQITYADYSGKTITLPHDKANPYKVSRLTSSRTLPDGSSYVAAILAQTASESKCRQNYLKIWHIGASTTGVKTPATFPFTTAHDTGPDTREDNNTEGRGDLLFSSDHHVQYLAAAGNKHLTVFRKEKGGDIFALHLSLTLDNSSRDNIQLSFPEKDLLTALYGTTLRHWELALTQEKQLNNFAKATSGALSFLPRAILCLINAYFDECTYTTNLASLSLVSTSYFKRLSPNTYQLICFNLTEKGDHIASLLPDIRKPELLAVSTGALNRHRIKTVAYGTNKQIVGGFDNGNIIYFDFTSAKPTMEIFKAHTGTMGSISSVALSPDSETIAVYIESYGTENLINIFKKQKI